MGGRQMGGTRLGGVLQETPVTYLEPCHVQKLLAFGATFCGSRNLERFLRFITILLFRAILSKM